MLKPDRDDAQDNERDDDAINVIMYFWSIRRLEQNSIETIPQFSDCTLWLIDLFNGRHAAPQPELLIQYHCSFVTILITMKSSTVNKRPWRIFI